MPPAHQSTDVTKFQDVDRQQDPSARFEYLDRIPRMRDSPPGRRGGIVAA